MAKIIVEVDKSLKGKFKSKIRKFTDKSMSEVIRDRIEKYCEGQEVEGAVRSKRVKLTVLLNDDLKEKFLKSSINMSELIRQWMRDTVEEFEGDSTLNKEDFWQVNCSR